MWPGKPLWQRFFSLLPLASILWASLQPISPRAQQALVFFTLLWLYAFLLSEVWTR